jgi:hypothetical protein
MAISETEIKKLWGRAAGHCSAPGCNVNCIELLANSEAVVLGEMAHVIPRSPGGPRGTGVAGSDKYENLILLCPTHHRLVDKAPAQYPEELLLLWKQKHELRVDDALKAPTFHGKADLFKYISYLLIENHSAWQNYGPDSNEAKQNPLSSLFPVWTLRKLSLIVPNNRRIINAIVNNRQLLNNQDYSTCREFIEHAEGFEQNCYERREGVPQFPINFRNIVEQYAR